jgi:hypothetical protein
MNLCVRLRLVAGRTSRGDILESDTDACSARVGAHLREVASREALKRRDVLEHEVVIHEEVAVGVVVRLVHEVGACLAEARDLACVVVTLECCVHNIWHEAINGRQVAVERRLAACTLPRRGCTAAEGICRKLLFR